MGIATAQSTDLQITGSFVPAPLVVSSFAVLIASPDSSLDGDRSRAYASPQAVQADSDVSAGAQALAAALAANGYAGAVVVARWDPSASPTPETVADALGGASDDGRIWYWTLVQSMTISVIEAARVWINANGSAVNPYVLLWSTDDAGAITSSPPGGELALREDVRAWPVFSPQDSQVPAAVWCGANARIDLDSQCPGGTPIVTGATAYDLTGPQFADAVDNGYNVILPSEPGSSVRVVREGVAAGDEPAYTIISLDWYGVRVGQDFTSIRQRFDALNRKLPLGPAGEALLIEAAAARARQGVEAGHFGTEALDDLPDGYEITAVTDRAQRTITVTARLAIQDSVRTIALTYTLER